MRLSKRGEYGVRAMLLLAGTNPPGELVQIKQIALKENIPMKYLEQILLILRHAGLLRSRMGVGGGYQLAKSSQEITLGQIIRTLDGPIAPVNCVSQMAYEPCDCPDENTCGLRMAMLDVRNEMSNILDKTSLADVLLRMATRTVA
ncbi:MAG: RrF2 family transcriptional regulator [Anaerolineales bacterium]